jgi:hypothetical protein
LKQTEGIKLPLTLQGVLRDLGWPNTESDRLIFGDPLTTLPDSLNDPLMNLIRPDLTLSRPFGGWLSSTRGADLLVKLNDCAPHFLDSKRNSFLSRHSSKESGLGPKQAIEMYRSALTMLERLQSLPTGYVLRCIAP